MYNSLCCLKSCRPAPPITHEALILEPDDGIEKKEEGIKIRGLPKTSSKEELMSLLNLLRLYHGDEVGEQVKVALKVKRGRLGRRQSFKTRKDWLQAIRTAITQSSEERRESQKLEAEMEEERQRDLERLKAIRMQEKEKAAMQKAKESKEEQREPKVSLQDLSLRKEELLVAAKKLERQKLALMLLLQDSAHVANSRN